MPSARSAADEIIRVFVSMNDPTDTRPETQSLRIARVFVGLAGILRPCFLQHSPYLRIARAMLEKTNQYPVRERATMVSHCANPACGVPLQYLRHGRLYQFEVRCTNGRALLRGDAESGSKGRHISHYWLCGECATLLTLQFDPAEGVIPVAIESSAASRAVA